MLLKAIAVFAITAAFGSASFLRETVCRMSATKQELGQWRSPGLGPSNPRLLRFHRGTSDGRETVTAELLNRAAFVIKLLGSRRSSDR